MENTVETYNCEILSQIGNLSKLINGKTAKNSLFYLNKALSTVELMDADDKYKMALQSYIGAAMEELSNIKNINVNYNQNGTLNWLVGTIMNYYDKTNDDNFLEAMGIEKINIPSETIKKNDLLGSSMFYIINNDMSYRKYKTVTSDDGLATKVYNEDYAKDSYDQFLKLEKVINDPIIGELNVRQVEPGFRFISGGSVIRPIKVEILF